ncbi:hypothetical protein LguiA_031226 [Lonicera macranthoides]
MASLLLRAGLKVFNSASTIVISQTSSVSSVSRRLPVMTFNIGRFAKISTYTGRSEEVDEDNIICASVVRSKFPYSTNVYYGRYKFLLRKFVLKMEEEAAEQGLSSTLPPPLRISSMSMIVRLFAMSLQHMLLYIQTPSSTMLDSDYQLIKVLAEVTIVGRMEAAENAYAASPTTCIMLIKNGL